MIKTFTSKMHKVLQGNFMVMIGFVTLAIGYT